MSRILVTGFGPFVDVPFNVSGAAALAVSAADDATAASPRLIGAALPVDYRRASRRLAELVTEHLPDAIIATGVCRGPRPRLELRAHNRVTSRAPDNAGWCPAGEVIVAGGPGHLDTCFPVAAWVAALGSAGHPVARSLDAGGYVCNAVYAHALAQVDGRAVFLHVPAVGADVGPEGVVVILRALGRLVDTWIGSRPVAALGPR